MFLGGVGKESCACCDALVGSFWKVSPQKWAQKKQKKLFIHVWIFFVNLHNLLMWVDNAQKKFGLFLTNWPTEEGKKRVGPIMLFWIFRVFKGKRNNRLLCCWEMNRNFCNISLNFRAEFILEWILLTFFFKNPLHKNNYQLKKSPMSWPLRLLMGRPYCWRERSEIK